MFSLKNNLKPGQTLAEFGLVCGLISIATLIALTQSGTQISGIFNTVNANLGNALSATPGGLTGNRPQPLNGITNPELGDRRPETGGSAGIPVFSERGIPGNGGTEESPLQVINEVGGTGGVQVEPEVTP